MWDPFLFKESSGFCHLLILLKNPRLFFRAPGRFSGSKPAQPQIGSLQQLPLNLLSSLQIQGRRQW